MKANSYNNQDKKKGRLRYNDKYECWTSKPLSHSDIIEIIREQGLDCHYCKDQTRIIPNSRKDQYQFTLDRKDNNKSHTPDNLLVCCYSCNEMRSNVYSVGEFSKIRRRCVSDL